MYNYCKTCRHDDGDIGFCDKCLFTIAMRRDGLLPTEYEEEPRPQTNADRIRSMTDDELDKFLGDIQWDVANYCGGVTQNQIYPIPEQRGAWLDWLKEEWKDGRMDN